MIRPSFLYLSKHSSNFWVQTPKQKALTLPGPGYWWIPCPPCEPLLLHWLWLKCLWETERYTHNGRNNVFKHYMLAYLFHAPFLLYWIDTLGTLIVCMVFFFTNGDPKTGKRVLFRVLKTGCLIFMFSFRISFLEEFKLLASGSWAHETVKGWEQKGNDEFRQQIPIILPFFCNGLTFPP